MTKSYFTDQIFTPVSFQDGFQRGEYDGCTFEQIDFTSLDITQVIFAESTFIECNLSNLKLAGTAFRNCQFEECKLLGLHFENCNPFLLEFNFSHCTLDYSSFFQLKLPSTQFTGSSLMGADFTESNLSGSDFDNALLIDARFERTNLEKCDFRTAQHFSINPSSNAVKGARFSKQNLVGLLSSFPIKIE